MEQWDIIKNNPKFQSAFGPQVTGDPQDWWNNLLPKEKEYFNMMYGTGEPVLNQQPKSDGSVTVNPVLSGDRGFERVMVGNNFDYGSVLYNSQTGEVKAIDGDPVSALYMQNSNIQNIAKDKYNQNLAVPVQNAQKDLNTMERIVDASEGDVSGPVLNQYTNAKNNLSSAQQAALSQVSDPSDVDMSLGRPSYTTPNMTGLDALTEERNANNINNPMSQPVLTSLPNMTNNNQQVDGQFVPRDPLAVDFADPTMVPERMGPMPMQGPALGMNEEAGRGNIYDTYRSPVLIDTSKPNNETTAGVLGTTGGPSVRSIMSSSGPKTSNRRQSDMPSMLVDRNEALIRIGGAMYSGGLQGDGIGAATREYGAIQDANRATAMEQYKTDQATKLAMAKAAAKGKKGDDSTKALNATYAQMDSYQSALQAIADSRAAGGNLTGVGGIFKSFLDNFTGDEDAARRLILNKVKVDDALLRVAHTKGAISNAEMKLFLRPAPKDYMDEAIWEDWLNKRVAALEKVQYRLINGQEVPDDMKGPNVSDTRASINNASGSDDGQFSIKEVTPK